MHLLAVLAFGCGEPDTVALPLPPPPSGVPFLDPDAGDVFTFSVAPRVDVLWVVQPGAAAVPDVEAFLPELDPWLFDSGLDVRMAAMSADGNGTDGPWYEAGDMLPVRWLQRLPSGDGGSRGLDLILSVMEDRGSLRADAAFRVVVVSDADDESEVRTADFLDRFTWGPSPRSVSAMVPESASQYRSAARNTGGDWIASDRDLDFLFETLSGLRRAFVLSGTPRVDTIEVYLRREDPENPGQYFDALLNGDHPAGIDPRAWWSYNRTTNRVTLSGYVPRLGDTVRILYALD